MRTMQLITRTARRWTAAGCAVFALSGAAHGQSILFAKNAELLPGFPDAALKDRSVLFSNAVYEAWITQEGYLRATPLKDGKPAGPTVRLFSPHFRGSKDRGGFVVHEVVEGIRADSKLPARQPATPVRYRADAEFGGRVSVAISFDERTIHVDAKFSRTKGTGSTTAYPCAVISVQPGFSSIPEKGAPPDMLARCEGKYIDIVPDSGAPVAVSFAEDIRKSPPPLAREWLVRGLWEGVALRGRTSTRGFTFRYGQYKGHMPAEGFWFCYHLTRATDSTKVSFEFEPYDGPFDASLKATAESAVPRPK